jgi:hypothetical protein
MLLFLFSLLFEASCHFQAAYMWHTSVATTRLLSDDVLRSNKPTTEKAWFSLFLSLSLSLFFFSLSLFRCHSFSVSLSLYLSVSISVSLSFSFFDAEQLYTSVSPVLLDVCIVRPAGVACKMFLRYLSRSAALKW